MVSDTPPPLIKGVNLHPLKKERGYGLSGGLEKAKTTWTSFSARISWGHSWALECHVLVAPYCAIPRNYLSDTPLLGFLVSQDGKLGAIPPPLFLSVSPLESMRSGGAIPPPQKGYLSDTGAIPCENKQNACDTPLCDTISKGYCAIWGGISHWAAKVSSDWF